MKLEMLFFAIAAIAAGQPTRADAFRVIGPHSAKPPIGDGGIDIVDTYGDVAFPPDQLAIIGSVIDANSYLNVTRDFVYSDFNVKIEEVLRQDAGDTVRAGDTLTTWRRGGSIRFASGHIMDFVTLHQGFPITGERYVFFLWGRWPDMHGRYQISAAYQLTGGVVQGLDSKFSAYDNVPEEQFLKTVKAAIASPKK